MGKIDVPFVSALLAGLLALSCTSWNAVAGAHQKKAGAAHARYYLYDPPQHALPSVSRARDDGRKLCYLPSEGCDNDHSITN